MQNMFATTQTGQTLHGEHQATLAALNNIDALCHARRAPDPANATVKAQLEDIARVLEDDVTRHFGYEEEVLFPVLRNAGAGMMVDMLEGEHEIIRPLAARVRALCLSAVAEGRFDPQSWEMLTALGDELVERETFHIQKEEMGLLGALSQVLSADEDRALAARHPAQP